MTGGKRRKKPSMESFELKVQLVAHPVGLAFPNGKGEQRDQLLQLFFEPTETSRAAGAAFWDRLQRRAGERDPSLVGPGVQAQRTALTRWDRTEDAAYPHVRAIAHPVLVAGGSHDLIIPTVNAFVLAQRLPNAQLILYPDSGHGFLFQYHTLFGKHATLFLES